MKGFKKIKQAFQRFIKGFCDYDIYSLYDWFIKNFPKMLDEFAQKTNSYPCCWSKLRKDAYDLPAEWVETQVDTVSELLKNNHETFDLDNYMTQWLLIILRLKYCFEMCNDFNDFYEKYDSLLPRDKYIAKWKEIEQYKEEGFRLFESYFFDLWW